MTEYTAGPLPVKEADVSAIAAIVKPLLNDWQNRGMNGLDVALGTISALRMFVLYNVGPEGLQTELNQLATVLRGRKE